MSANQESGGGGGLIRRNFWACQLSSVYERRDKFERIGRISFRSNYREISFHVKDNLDIIELNNQVSGKEEKKNNGE